MASIALIAEGLTDQIVIERLIEAIYSADDDDPLIVTYAQPIRDRHDAHHAPHAGWEKVFEYCEFTIADALAANDYVVVHIDTDAGDHINYGLPLVAGGFERTYADLIEEATVILIRKMGDAATEQALSRVIFAVAVHATESWLLLIMYGENHLKSTFKRLVRKMRRDNKNLKKEGRSYLALVNSISDRSILRQVDSEHSVGIFLRSLRRKVSLTLDAPADDV